jgi:hypothetical protein
MPIKRHGEEQRKGIFLHSPGYIVERGKIDIQPIFNHLLGTDLGFSFK